MESFLKAAHKKAAGAAAKIGNELQNELRIYEKKKEGERDLKFEDGPFGFELEGAIVVSVAEDGQAAKLGVQVGDRLLAVAGYPVPKPRSSTDKAGERRAKIQIKQWLDEMPRPGVLAFASPTAFVEGAEADKKQEDEFTSATIAISEGNATSSVGFAEVDYSQSCSLQGDSEQTAANLELQRLRSELLNSNEQVSGLRAELRIVQEQSQCLESDLDEARAECQQLRHLAAAQCEDGISSAQARLEMQVKTLQHELTSKRDEHEALRRQNIDLQTNLTTANSQSAELRLALAHAEEVALETSEGREQVLEDEVARLRREMSGREAETHEVRKAAEEMVANAKEQIGSLEAKVWKQTEELKDLRAQGAAKDASVRELHRLREEHVAQLEELRQERDASLVALQLREQRTARELEDVRAELVKLQAASANSQVASQKPDGREDSSEDEDELEASLRQQTLKVLGLDTPAGEAVEEFSAPLEGEEARRQSNQNGSGSSPSSPKIAAVDGSEVSALYERISFLEGKCSSLQKKLNSRPIVCQAMRPVSSQDALESGGTAAQVLPWEPQLRSLLGPLAGDYAIRCQHVVDRGLRRLTERLLTNSAWLWLFYAHVVILYTIASSCYAETAVSKYGNPADAMQIQQVAASAASAVAVSSAGSGSKGN